MNENQRYVWDSIAEPWHRFRRESREDDANFLKDKKGIVLDLACGSGRNFISGCFLVDVDFSKDMLKYAKERINGNNAVLVQADASELPFKNNVFDSILFSSSFHCIEKEKRGRCLSEIKRIAKSGSEIFISVWNKNQPRFFFAKKESYIPWKVGDKIYHRYYYLFTINEMKNLLEKNFEILRIYGSSDKAFKLFPRNIIAIAKNAGVPKSGQRG